MTEFFGYLLGFLTSFLSQMFVLKDRQEETTIHMELQQKNVFWD